MNKTTQNGFSLIELLIVVAIILIIASVAIPNLVRAKIAANQASAVGSLRTIDSSSVAYSSSYEGYPPALAQLGPAAGGTANCNAAGLIDSLLVTGAKSGYAFTWHVGSIQVSAASIPPGCPQGYIDMYSATADPSGFPTGTIHYCVDATGVIRQSTSTVGTTAVNGCDVAAGPVGNQ